MSQHRPFQTTVWMTKPLRERLRTAQAGRTVEKFLTMLLDSYERDEREKTEHRARAGIVAINR